MTDQEGNISGLTHEYNGSVRIVPSDTPGVSAEIVYQGLIRYPAPGTSGNPVYEGSTSVLTGNNLVRHYLNPDLLMVTNVTVPGGHILSGVAHRSVAVENGWYVVKSWGLGNSGHPLGRNDSNYAVELFNSVFGGPILNSTVFGIRGYVLKQAGPDAMAHYAAVAGREGGVNTVLIDGKYYTIKENGRLELTGQPNFDLGPECFLEDTQIDMWDGSKKSIQDIAPDDLVVSYDKSGKLVPGKVTRTFQNHAKHILDVHGLMMTPGHVTFCGEGKFVGKHVPVLDILRSDGALMNKEGELIRAATGYPVGSDEDRIIPAIITEFIGDGAHTRILERGTVRLGTTFMANDGRTITVKEIIRRIGLSIREDGYIEGFAEGQRVEKHSFVWTFGKTLPKPENYILQRSAVTLEEIYSADEWETVPQMPTPYQGEAGPSFVKYPSTLYAGGFEDVSPPNIPFAMRGNKNQPIMSRKQRRAYDAKERKRSKVKVH